MRPARSCFCSRGSTSCTNCSGSRRRSGENVAAGGPDCEALIECSGPDFWNMNLALPAPARGRSIPIHSSPRATAGGLLEPGQCAHVTGPLLPLGLGAAGLDAIRIGIERPALDAGAVQRLVLVAGLQRVVLPE